MLKFAFVTLLVSLTFSFANASGGNSGNDPIFDDSQYVPQWPTVDFGGIAVPINNVCDTGSNFKTIRPVPVCLKEVVESEVECTQSESCHQVPLDYIPRYGETIRLQWRCDQWETRSLDVSRSRRVLKCSGNMIYPHDEKSSSPYCDGQWVPTFEEITGQYDVPLVSKQSLSTDQGYKISVFKPYVILDVPPCKTSTLPQ